MICAPRSNGRHNIREFGTSHAGSYDPFQLRRPHGDRSKILKGATDMEHERMADREKMETIVQKMAEPHR